MKKQTVTNKDIMKRLDELEKGNTTMSAIFLLYSLAVTLVVSYNTIKDFQFVILGTDCYISGGLLTIRHRIKKRFTSRNHRPS